MFLLRLFDECAEEICFDNSSATGRIDKDPTPDELKVGCEFEVSMELSFLELTGVGIFDGNGGGDE